MNIVFICAVYLNLGIPTKPISFSIIILLLYYFQRYLMESLHSL